MVSKNLFKENIKNSKVYTLALLRWVALSLIIGLVCGAIGALFYRGISFVTTLRLKYDWLLYLLPIGGLASVFIYKRLKVYDLGTGVVFDSVRSEKQLPILLAPAVFLGSLITHLFGGSAGREGAALQIGGSISSIISKAAKLSEKDRHILTMCGMGALFSAVFGTPAAAAVFAIEVVYIGKICSGAIFPVLLSSVCSYFVSVSLGTIPESFKIESFLKLTPENLVKVFVIAIICALVTIFFCSLLHHTEKFFKKTFKSGYLRMFVGACLIVILSLILGTHMYLGGGMEYVEGLFHGSPLGNEAFILKLIFTVITVSAGLKGGEIVPTFFIGATLGYSLGLLFGIDPACAAAIGMITLFCSATNCPLASIVLSVELFSSEGIVFFALACGIGFFLSGQSSLYTEQRFFFSKLDETIIE